LRIETEPLVDLATGVIHRTYSYTGDTNPDCRRYCVCRGHVVANPGVTREAPTCIPCTAGGTLWFGARTLDPNEDY